MTNAYIPGVCNIGPAEIARRRRSGVVGAAGTVAVLAGTLLTDAPKPLRLLVVLPAAGGASGFLQAASHFCGGFGLRGVFNFGDTGTTETIEQEEFRAEDRRKAVRLFGTALAIGVGVGAAALLLP